MTSRMKKTLVALAVIGGLAAAPVAYAASTGFIGAGHMGPGFMQNGPMGGFGPMGARGQMRGFGPMMGENMADLGDMPKMTDEQLAYVGKMLAGLSPERRAFVKQRMQEHGIVLPDSNDAPATK